jgi:undecaprenyl-diphosphatase
MTTPSLDPGTRRFGRAHVARLAGWFLVTGVPLFVFGSLAEDVWTAEGFAWDAPVLRALHRFSSPAHDRLMIVASALVMWLLLPAVLVALVLLRRRGLRSRAVFLAFALGGGEVLNLGAKLLFHRTRPSLWLSPTPETTFSFPSGHAMGSAIMVAALVVLAWRSRWRWAVAVPGTLVVLLVGVSRVYLGVHYPSDVVGAWAAAVLWVSGCATVFRRALRVPEPVAGEARQRAA